MNPKVKQMTAELEYALLNRPLTKEEIVEHNQMVREFNANQARLVKGEDDGRN